MESLRYVVLRHEGVDEPHFDLMFESEPGGLLKTWRAENWPTLKGMTLTPLPLHRRIYLEFEGEISGNRGSVRQIAAGVFSPLQNSDRVFIAMLDQIGEICFTKKTDAEWKVG